MPLAPVDCLHIAGLACIFICAPDHRRTRRRSDVAMTESRTAYTLVAVMIALLFTMTVVGALVMALPSALAVQNAGLVVFAIGGGGFALLCTLCIVIRAWMCCPPGRVQPEPERPPMY